jgi:ankyrin repeat protein
MLRFHFLDYAAQYWPSHAEKLTTADMDLFEQLDGFTKDKSHDFESWKDFWNGMNTSIPANLSPLHVAAHCSLAAYTEHLLIQGADLNLADSYGRTPTSYAAMEGHARALKFLIEHNARFSNPDARGLAPIQHAAKRNQPATLRVLLEAGADPLIGPANEDPYFNPEYHESTIHETALFYVCHYGNVAALNERLKHLDPSQLLAGPLHWAADCGRAEILIVLLQHEEVRIHINDIDAAGNTPLYLAARAQDSASVRVLIEHKADVNARSEDKEIMRGRRMRREIPPRIQKQKLGYTAIHALMNLNSYCGPGSSVAEIKEILDLLISVCISSSFFCKLGAHG